MKTNRKQSSIWYRLITNREEQLPIVRCQNFFALNIHLRNTLVTLSLIVCTLRCYLRNSTLNQFGRFQNEKEKKKNRERERE